MLSQAEEDLPEAMADLVLEKFEEALSGPDELQYMNKIGCMMTKKIFMVNKLMVMEMPRSLKLRSGS